MVQIEPGEVPQFALQRELHEELGIEVRRPPLPAAPRLPCLPCRAALRCVWPWSVGVGAAPQM